MKITSVEYWRQDIKLSRPYTITYVTHDVVTNIFVKVNCADGSYGIGAGSPSEHVTGELIDTDFSKKSDLLGQWMVDTDVRHYRSTIDMIAPKLDKQPALMAAIDMALHDAFCKYIKTPLCHYLGIRIRPLPTSITIGIMSVADTLEEGKEYEERGFKAIKLKLGNDLEEDIERYIKLREQVSNDIVIRVDANQGYDMAALRRFIDETSAAPVEFFEQPMKPKQYEAMRSLPAQMRSQCMGDEDIQKLTDAVNWAQMPLGYGYYNIKIMKCGGITEGKRIADVAATRDIPLMWGCMDESCISISASLAAAMSSPNTGYLDLDGSLDLAEDIATGGFTIKDGIIYPIEDAYGLGVKLI